MDEYTEIFVALGAATAANCGPCFEHYFSRAEELGINKGDIQRAVDIAVKVRGGAHMVLQDAIRRILKSNAAPGENCCSGASSACCD